MLEALASGVDLLVIGRPAPEAPASGVNLLVIGRPMLDALAAGVGLLVIGRLIAAASDSGAAASCGLAGGGSRVGRGPAGDRSLRTGRRGLAHRRASGDV
ncbi:hypothetical protein [Actinoallomurus sp. CA-142502]|uniref:hypothetical protein n=1 Tax=Actinoallomurus sp. CA-142502 TaxID=3239885 RepID=UPI003D8D2A5A